jgi:hypothetical protein
MVFRVLSTLDIAYNEEIGTLLPDLKPHQIKKPICSCFSRIHGLYRLPTDATFSFH